MHAAYPPRTDAERAYTTSLLRLARTYRKAVDHALAEHGLSDARAIPVLHLATLGGGVRQGVLAEALGVEGPSIARTVEQLCAAGLVERRDDPADGRAKTLHLTQEGYSLAAVVEVAMRGVRGRVLRHVSDADLRTAVAVGAAFEAAIEGRDGGG